MNSLAVANYILDVAEKAGISVTPMQLQKLVYFANGWHMEIFGGEKLVQNNFEAWQFGPVMPIIYHDFKKYGSSPITGRAFNPFSQQPWVVDLDEKQKKVIEDVIGLYGNMSGAKMSHLTHKKNTPWSRTWDNGFGSGNDIEPELILEEFKAIRKNAEAA